MKLAIAGSGGVGKTTLTSLLAYNFAEEGKSVLAIDADPSPLSGRCAGYQTISAGLFMCKSEVDAELLESLGLIQ